MKEKIRSTLAIVACVALCALVRAEVPTGEEVSGQMPIAAVSVKTAAMELEPEPASFSGDEPALITMQSESNKDSENFVAAEAATAMTAAEAKAVPTPTFEEAEIVPSHELIPASEPQTTTVSSGPYHTDIYPNNNYSEELIYDTDGNLIGKTVTYPTAFGSDTIWIDGRAYYDIHGFGLVEWSGPSQRTENYTMYESGVKVGIMGGEAEAPANSTTANQPTESHVPASEVIDQTINTVPEKNSTPPDSEPQTAPSTK